jgi:hypothetical protein
MIDYKDFQDRMRDVIDYMSYWDRQAYADFRFAALDQWDAESKERLREQGRPHLVLDKTRIIIDAVSGNEILNRMEPKFYPRNLPGEDIDLEASEVIGELYRWIRQQSDVEYQESAMFRDMLISGVGCTDTYMDYTDNPDGRIVTVRVPIFQVSWDPTSQDGNFADANFVVRDKWIPEKEFVTKYPEFEGAYRQSGDLRENRLMQRVWDRVTNRDVHTYGGSRSFQYFDPKHEHVHVWEYQWRELKPVTRVMIPNAQGSYDEQIVPREQEESFIQEVSEMNMAFQEMAAEQGVQVMPEVQWQPFNKYYYNRAIIAGKEIVEESEEPLGEFTLKFCTGFEDWSKGDKKYYFGLMKPMRDPQRYVNSFFSQAVHLWNTSPKGVLIHEPNFFEDEEDAYKKWAQANKPIRAQHGAISGTAKDKFIQVQNNRSFAGTESLFQYAREAIPEASGVNPNYTAGLTGDVRRAATSAIQLVQQQNLSTLGTLFDSLERYRKAHANLAIQFMREYMPDEQAVRILGPNKANMVQFSKDDLVRQYDIVVADGPSSPNFQMEIMDKLVQTDLFSKLIEMQLWPAEGWKYIGLPSDLGNQIMMRQQQIEQMMAEQATEPGAPPPEEQ